MNFKSSTKNTHVYTEDENSKETGIPQLYVRKSALPAKPPEVILVTIESQD